MSWNIPELLQSGFFADENLTKKALENTYRQLFPYFLGVYAGQIFNPAPSTSTPTSAAPADDRETIHGIIQTHQERISLSNPMLILSITTISLFTVVIATVYTIQPGKFLIYIPTTLVATIPMVHASRITEELKGMLEMTVEERKVFLMRYNIW
jgi:hypothetical protein